jgi:steroid delta-isomerase-like uncharacterized protein
MTTPLTATEAVNEILEHLQAETAKDYDALLDTMTDDCFNFVAADPTSPYLGPKEVEARYRKLFAAFPDLRIEMKRIVALDLDARLAISENLLTGTHEGDLFGIPGTGKRIDLSAIVIWEFGEDNKVRGETIYYDLATLLRQIGYLTLPGRSND